MKGDELHSIHSTHEARALRHAHLAATNLNKSWFPVNEQVLTTVRENLREGVYSQRQGDLVSDLKQDFSLFTYCIKELANLIHASLGENTVIDPANALSQAQPGVIADILDIDAAGVSQFSLEESNSAQSLQIQKGIMSATVCEVLAEQHEIDPELAYTTALFRQLGLTLIAWNYPGIFQSALNSSSSRLELEDELNRMLGFSPALLGIIMARNWNLALPVRQALGDEYLPDTSAEEDPITATVGNSLEKLCRIGEAFADGFNENFRSQHARSWEEARLSLERTLGHRWLSILQERIEKSCRAYFRILPEAFSFEALSQSERASKDQLPRVLAANNRYLRHCPATLQNRLRKFYEKIGQSSVTRTSVSTFVEEILPQAGFQRGCIYLVDPTSRKLYPRLKVGQCSLQEFPSIDYRPSTPDFSPIAAAYRSRTPIMEEDMVIDGRRISYVAGVLGETQRAGVLYLEFSKEPDNSSQRSMMLIFKAVRQALSDLLNLF